MRITRFVLALGLCLSSGAVFAALSVEPALKSAPDKAGQKLAALEIVGGDTPAQQPEVEQTEGAEPEPSEPQDVAEPAAPVVYSTPLASGGADVEGLTLEQLIEGSPLFPPIEGLPEQLWKGKTCSTCHQWQRADLCDQAKRYLPETAQQALKKQHPYGGALKLHLKAWAQNDCQ
ncbi:hypothetical protein [Neptunicoccus cionae]|uniref:Cytochrome c domain-containing protein n=1 Tax=Neptunicoccus cionae TaxID=2035344 RepID=A0A916VP77_9RHOB|nr:hypothetical protein [Amylibacter cionae]GGA15687.1 hypothetical protein GCM10011498_15050 [Amylibacter cionae]